MDISKIVPTGQSTPSAPLKKETHVKKKHADPAIEKCWELIQQRFKNALKEHDQQE